ncbi:hypothetical protein MTO96_003572 [Rhipicephalus appendiculatus]
MWSASAWLKVAGTPKLTAFVTEHEDSSLPSSDATTVLARRRSDDHGSSHLAAFARDDDARRELGERRQTT